MNAAAERGAAVPEFLSIVGFDDLPTSSWPLVQLTTVAYDLAVMSREAGRLVVELVSTPGATFEHVVLSTNLVRRRSLAASAGIARRRLIGGLWTPSSTYVYIERSLENRPPM